MRGDTVPRQHAPIAVDGQQFAGRSRPDFAAAVVRRARLACAKPGPPRVGFPPERRRTLGMIAAKLGRVAPKCEEGDLNPPRHVREGRHEGAKRSRVEAEAAQEDDSTGSWTGVDQALYAPRQLRGQGHDVQGLLLGVG
jgi:hypothetical protein